MQANGLPTANELLLQQIQVFELANLRALREFILGDPTAVTRLQAVNTQIVALRAQIVQGP